MSSTIWRYLELKFRKFGERIDQNDPFSIDCKLKENLKPISVSASSTAQQQICVCLLFALKGENLSYRPKTDSAPASAPARQYSLFTTLVVAVSLPQLTQASFLQKNQTLQNRFLISVTLRWHRVSVACKSQSFYNS